MPRIAGVSITSTVSLRNFSPSPWATVACFLSKPMVLFTSFTLIRLVSACFFAARLAMARRPHHLRQLLAAQPGHHQRILQRHQPLKRGAYDVVRVGRT